MRGSHKMTWVKLYITGWLHGSIRYQLEPDERGVWADLIAMAGQCLSSGRICDNDGQPYPKQYIANQLNVPIELLERTITKCEKEGRVQDIDGVIAITHWETYQSEYERQRKYRKKRDNRRAPNETEAEFKERLKLFNASVRPDVGFQKKSDELVEQAIGHKINRE